MLAEGGPFNFARGQITKQAEAKEATRLCAILRQETNQLLADRGVANMDFYKRAMSYASLGGLAYTLSAAALGVDLLGHPELIMTGTVAMGSVLLIDKLYPFKRFFESSQTTDIRRQLIEGDQNLTAVIRANDGNPGKASKVEIALLPSTEFMVLDGNHGTIACTEDDPRFEIITRDGINGRRFDGAAYRFIRPTTPEDTNDYLQLVRKLAAA